MHTRLLLCLALLALALADQCPDGGECEEGGTCCQTPQQGYECCPMHQAECCGDHKHCCPEGTSCQVSESRCVNATASLPWVQRHRAKPSGLSRSFRMIRPHSGEEEENVCPDESHCPAEFSCLEALRGYGCCPLAQGVPCVDGKHCCPEGHQCSLDGRSCVEHAAQLVSMVICSDQVSECPGDTTCCVNPDRTWGCCPGLKAVSCADNIHCCPEGTTCDIQQSKCLSTNNRVTPMLAKLPARTRAQWENQNDPDTARVPQPPQTTSEMFVPCNGSVACPDGSTCCKTQSGDWACCPLVEAVCCSDFIHCCPKGMTCDVASGTCISPLGPGSVRWSQKTPSLPRKVELQAGNVTCDSSHSCPDQTTCCKTATGDWACCPLPQAVCCEDHEHCCPHGTICDLATLTCNGAWGAVPVVKKVGAVTTPTTPEEEEVEEEEEKRIQCDPHTSCPRRTTCCMMSSGWGCCPLPEATCCSDGDHCCPTHYKCNKGSSSCSKGDVEIPWYNKLPAEPQNNRPAESSVRCDADSSCPEGATCCQLSAGRWGCCPLKEAVCCPDQEHCCPQGYSCNMYSGSCQRLIWLEVQTLPLTRVFLSETKAQPRLLHQPQIQPPPQTQPQLQLQPQTQPPPQTQPQTQPQTLPQTKTQPTNPQGKGIYCAKSYRCRDGETCCKTTNTWSCCPLPNAVCCGDMQHCCSSGFTCGEAGTCIQSSRLSWDEWQLVFTNRKSAL